jgi:hypothetical protein
MNKNNCKNAQFPVTLLQKSWDKNYLASCRQRKSGNDLVVKVIKPFGLVTDAAAK